VAEQITGNEEMLVKLNELFSSNANLWPSITVTYDDLTVTTDALLGSASVPSVYNTTKGLCSSLLCQGGLKTAPLTILDNITGMLKPGRLTLVMGPPGSGKSVFMQVLCGRLEASSKLQIKGSIQYNNENMDTFEPRRTAGLVGQYDYHIPNMTVLETVQFAFDCQVGNSKRAEAIAEVNKVIEALTKKTKETKGVKDAEAGGTEEESGAQGRHAAADEDVELLNFFKSIVANDIKPMITLKIMGLTHVADTVVGDNMTRGVSGGERKRVTTAEIQVGPQSFMLMDEISTGLDSATTYSVMQTFKSIAHYQNKTIAVSLLQPPPEVLYLFDDILLFTAGKVIYHGPTEEALSFFGSQGFNCPPRKDVGSFLQEVSTPLGQLAYGTPELLAKHGYSAAGAVKGPPKELMVTVEEMSDSFWNDSKWGKAMKKEMEEFKQKETSSFPKNALARTKYARPLSQLTALVLKRAWGLNVRNKSFLIARVLQALIIGLIIASLYARVDPTSADARNALSLSTLSITFLAMMSMPQVAMVFETKRVFFKQRDNNFYPAWSYSSGMTITQIPQSFMESVLFAVVVYWIAGLTSSASNFFIYWFVCFSSSNCFAALFRCFAYGAPSMVVANSTGSFVLLILMITNGFSIVYTSIPDYVVWIYWMNPLSWSLRSLAINELTSPRWNEDGSDIGYDTLEAYGFFTETYWIWAGVGFLWGVLILCTLFGAFELMVLNPPSPRPSISEEDQKLVVENDLAQQLKRLSVMGGDSFSVGRSPESLSVAQNAEYPRSAAIVEIESIVKNTDTIASAAAADTGAGTGVSVSFTPITLVVKNMCYYVDDPSQGVAPGVVKGSGDKVIEGKLQLLHSISCFAAPKQLVALMGGSGAGKTTLMDCIAGRKTQGLIRGDILVNGHPKEQKSWARVIGYVEQQDIHSAQATVYEALTFSARLRLDYDTFSDEEVKAIVEDTLSVVELGKLRDSIVGDPGGSGLSIEQRKRLSLGVELAASPSTIFMDEPTSGLDARAAAIVMRAIRNVGDSGRTVMVTIHQPSMEIFESFDQLILLQRGGRLTYFGSLGVESRDLINYLTSYPGVELCKEGYNPATYMLEVTGGSMSTTYKASDNDFPALYLASELRKTNEAIAEQLEKEGLAAGPPLALAGEYATPTSVQLRVIIKKFWILYWRSPHYNFTRLAMTIAIALLYGLIYFGEGDIPKSPDATTTIASVQNVLGLLFSMAIFLGMFNLISIQPFVSAEQQVFYRERACKMYSPVPYAASIGFVEIPYLIAQAVLMVCISYFMVAFEATFVKFIYFLLMFWLTISMYTMLGQFLIYATPNQLMAQLLSAGVNQLWTFFNGFLVPYSQIPVYWQWMNRISPTTWVIYGLGCSQMCDSEAVMTDAGNQTVKEFLDTTFGYQESMVWWCVLIVAAFFLFFRFSSVLMLKFVNFQKR
jgi:ABC-type multidrug transport system ATPase subunit/ABC-type multidrug transport system permease subunit